MAFGRRDSTTKSIGTDSGFCGSGASDVSAKPFRFVQVALSAVDGLDSRSLFWYAGLL